MLTIQLWIGLEHSDTEDDSKWLASKLLNVRLFDDEAGNRWKNSIVSQSLEILLVSQFTLHGYLKGTKPGAYASQAAVLS